MKYSKIFYFIYSLLIPIDLLGTNDMNVIVILATVIATTIASISFFKIQASQSPKKVDNFVLLTIISLGFCEYLGIFREYTICYFFAFFFALVSSISGFIFLDYRSNWRKRALANQNLMLIVPILLVLFFITDKFILHSIPNLAFFPASIAIIIFIFIFMIAFFRETNAKSYFYVIISCFFFFLALFLSSNIPLKAISHSPVLILFRFLYLVAKFYWVLGCTWALKISEYSIESEQNQRFMS
jgi:hypothetical protein